VNDMRRLMLFEELQGLCGIPVRMSDTNMSPIGPLLRLGEYLRSASRELAKIHFSPGCFPNRDPCGSFSITYSMAFPTRPVPPVTSTTADIVRDPSSDGALKKKRRIEILISWLFIQAEAYI
jgi:hypothetical protein